MGNRPLPSAPRQRRGWRVFAFVDSWNEVLAVILRHRLRVFLTALSVAWGIFMFVLLVGAGDGLRKGVEHDFRDDATNSIWIRGGKTSVPHRGRGPGRQITLNTQDLETVQRSVPGVEYISGRFYIWGNHPVARGSKKGSFELRGCHPDHRYIERTQMLEGRFINQIDIERRRKVVVISPNVANALFEPGEEVIGGQISIRGVKYRVVGLYADDGGEGEMRKIYVPITTAQIVYNGDDDVHHLMFTVGNASFEESQRMERAAIELLAARHAFDADDPRALFRHNNLERFLRIVRMFDLIEAFVWLVGIGTVLAGMISVSNIMLISVKERTLEIGIRKALGATPGAILMMILWEGLLITVVSGYTGLVAGTAVVEAVNYYLPDNEYLRSPAVDFRAALGATALLVVCGVASGLGPALHAARVRPIVAMREGA